MTAWLKSYGFYQSKDDPGIYVYDNGSEGIYYLALYVDDSIMVGKVGDFIFGLKSALADKFEIDDPGPVSWLLGMIVERDRTTRTIKLGHRHVIRNRNIVFDEPRMPLIIQGENVIFHERLREWRHPTPTARPTPSTSPWTSLMLPPGFTPQPVSTARGLLGLAACAIQYTKANLFTNATAEDVKKRIKELGDAVSFTEIKKRSPRSPMCTAFSDNPSDAYLLLELETLTIPFAQHQLMITFAPASDGKPRACMKPEEAVAVMNHRRMSLGCRMSFKGRMPVMI